MAVGNCNFSLEILLAWSSNLIGHFRIPGIGLELACK